MGNVLYAANIARLDPQIVHLQTVKFYVVIYSMDGFL